MAALAVAATACGARLDQQQTAAVAGGQPSGAGGGGTQTAARGTGTGGAGASTPGASAGSTASGATPGGAGPAGAPGPATAGGPTDPGAAPTDPQAPTEGSCTPTGGALDVGITDSSVTLGSVATVGGPVPGLFKDVQNGVKAYIAYVNSELGGVCGRQLDLQLADDRLDAGVNRSTTEQFLNSAFALVGSYSVVDDGGASVLEGTNMPDIGSNIGQRRNALPNNFAMTPLPVNATSNGAVPMFTYLKQTYGINRAAVVWPAQPDARSRGQLFVADLEAAGVPVVDTFEVAITETNYSGVANKMRDDQIDFFITALEVNGLAKLAQALKGAGYSPKVSYYGQQVYGGQFVALAGDAANGAIIAMSHDIVENAPNNPSIAKFAEWYQRANPGEDMGFFAIQGWIAGSMFHKALVDAGPSPTRDLVLEKLRTFTAFDADGMIAAINPAEKQPSGCFAVVTIEAGTWKRIDPPTGFRCG